MFLVCPQYGSVVSFTMVGKTFTFLLGSDAASLMFNSKNEDLSAEDVYSKITTPVFGKGVAYDVPNPVSQMDLNQAIYTLCPSLVSFFLSLTLFPPLSLSVSVSLSINSLINQFIH